MDGFPDFMKNPVNRIDLGSQYTKDIEGYVFDGADGSQMAFWTAYADRSSAGHSHDYDEYFVVVQGEYVLLMDGQSIVMGRGDEAYIPKGKVHGGEARAGTRTIHAFGARRAEREKGRS